MVHERAGGGNVANRSTATRRGRGAMPSRWIARKMAFKAATIPTHGWRWKSAVDLVAEERVSR
jgi:hypothetical protein